VALSYIDQWHMRLTLRALCWCSPVTKFNERGPRLRHLSAWLARRVWHEHHGSLGKDVFPAVPEVVAHQNIVGSFLSGVDEVFLRNLISSIAETVRAGVKAIDHQCPTRRAFPVLVYAERNCVAISPSHFLPGRQRLSVTTPRNTTASSDIIVLAVGFNAVVTQVQARAVVLDETNESVSSTRSMTRL
jgi:hypothetical protein